MLQQNIKANETIQPNSKELETLKETLIKGLTPFNSILCKIKVSPSLFLNVQYNKVDSEHLRNNRF